MGCESVETCERSLVKIIEDTCWWSSQFLVNLSGVNDRCYCIAGDLCSVIFKFSLEFPISDPCFLSFVSVCPLRNSFGPQTLLVFPFPACHCRVFHPFAPCHETEINFPSEKKRKETRISRKTKERESRWQIGLANDAKFPANGAEIKETFPSFPVTTTILSCFQFDVADACSKGN